MLNVCNDCHKTYNSVKTNNVKRVVHLGTAGYLSKQCYGFCVCVPHQMFSFMNFLIVFPYFDKFITWYIIYIFLYYDFLAIHFMYIDTYYTYRVSSDVLCVYLLKGCASH